MGKFNSKWTINGQSEELQLRSMAELPFQRAINSAKCEPASVPEAAAHALENLRNHFVDRSSQAPEAVTARGYKNIYNYTNFIKR